MGVYNEDVERMVGDILFGSYGAVADALAKSPSIARFRCGCGRTALMWAAKYDDAIAVEMLLPLSDLDAVDDNGVGLDAFAKPAARAMIDRHLLSLAIPGGETGSRSKGGRL